MVNFEKLVNKCALLQEAPVIGNNDITAQTNNELSETPTSPKLDKQKNETQEEQGVKTIRDFLNKKKDNIVDTFNGKFEKFSPDSSSKYKFPESAFSGIIDIGIFNAIRGTKDSSKFEETIKYVFPLLDLIGLLVDAKRSNVEFDEAYEIFIVNLKGYTGNPLEYQPKSEWGKQVKQDYYNKQTKLDVGKIVLSSSELQNKSIYFVILKLLEFRRTGKSGELDLEKIPESKTFIDKLLFDPNSYISGKLPVPAQDIKALYNDMSPSLILDVAIKAYNLFTQQAKTYAPNLDENQYKEVFKLFMDNNVDWGKYNSASTQSRVLQQSQQNASFDSTLELLYKTLLTEENETTTLKPFEGDKTYVLKNIQRNSKAVPQAGKLYESLETLANYIRVEAKKDVVGAVSKVLSGAEQLAKGLSLGVPTMGR